MSDPVVDDAGQLVRAAVWWGMRPAGIVTADCPGSHDYAVDWADAADSAAAAAAFAACVAQVGVSADPCRECQDCRAGEQVCGICVDPVAWYVYRLWELHRWNGAMEPVFAAGEGQRWYYTDDPAAASWRWDWSTQAWVAAGPGGRD